MVLKLARIGWILAFVFTLATWPVTYLMASNAKDVYIINKFSDDDIQMARDLGDIPARDDPEFRIKLIKVYGQPMLEEPQKIFCDDSQILRPQEDPSIALLPVDKEKGENPLQLKTVEWFAVRIFWVSAAVGLLIFLVWVVLLKRQQPAPPAAPSA